MKGEIRRDILKILKRSVIYIKESNSFRLGELSNHTLHNSAIFQDEDSISIAVIIYALSKIMKRDRKIPNMLIELLMYAKECLERKDFREYSDVIRKITKKIEEIDSKMNLYIQKVIDNAEIKKGSKIYERGISLARASEMLGVSQWEMMGYVGKTSIIDNSPGYITDINRKMKVTRKIFSSKHIKYLVFDSGPLITLALNHLLWVLDSMKKNFNGEFIISQSVKKEIIDTPLETRKFKFEALYTNRYIKNKTIQVYQDEDHVRLSKKLIELCNNCFFAKGNPIAIVHAGEMDTIAIAITTGSKNVVVDERTTRLLIENPDSLSNILQTKLHVGLKVDNKKLGLISKYLSGINVIRSTELAAFAYEMGLLDRYLPDRPYQRITLLDAVLWGFKLNGCAISENEIIELIAIENKKKI